MTGRRIPAAPSGLDTRGRRFWRTIHAAYELEPDETEVLVEVCRLLDQAEQLQAVLDADGLMTRGSVGQPRVHPAVAELRATRQTIGRLLAQLDLPDEDDQTFASPRQARGRRAARTRWAKTAEVRQLRQHGNVPDGA